MPEGIYNGVSDRVGEGVSDIDSILEGKFISWLLGLVEGNLVCLPEGIFIRISNGVEKSASNTDGIWEGEFNG